MERIDGRIVWGHIFTRNLNGLEETQFRSMMVLIGSIFIPKNGKERVWMASMDGMFSVASLFLSMTRDVMVSHSQLASPWKIKPPPRVIAFRWSALLGGILMMNNLRYQRVLIVNACPMCLEDEDPLTTFWLIEKYLRSLWKLVMGWFQCGGTLPNSLRSLFEYY